MTKTISLTDGVPPHDGSYIFLLWDGSLVEGVLHHEDGRRLLTHYNLHIPYKPEPITHSADGGKIVAYAPLTDRGRASSDAAVAK